MSDEEREPIDELIDEIIANMIRKGELYYKRKPTGWVMGSDILKNQRPHPEEDPDLAAAHLDTNGDADD